MATVFVESYALPSVDRREVLRYSGVRSSSGETEELNSLLDTAISISSDVLDPRVCFCELALSELDLGGSLDLKNHLRDCHSAIIFASTLGVALDRLIFRYGVISPATALMLESLGNERIEALCDAFCSSVATRKAQENSSVTSRFSAGYGDLPLEYQKKIFDLLDPPSRIGLTLNSSYLMSPSKSVTAIIGIKKIKGN